MPACTKHATKFNEVTNMKNTLKAFALELSIAKGALF